MYVVKIRLIRTERGPLAFIVSKVNYCKRFLGTEIINTYQRKDRQEKNCILKLLQI